MSLGARTNCFRMVLATSVIVFGLVCTLYDVRAACGARVNCISDGNVCWRVDNDNFFAGMDTDLRVGANANCGGGVDHQYSFGFWYRVSGDTSETRLLTPDSSSYTGDTATFNWSNVDSRGFDMEVTVRVADNGGDLDFITGFTVTNDSGSTLDIEVFNYFDFDMDSDFGDDDAILLSGSDTMQVSDLTNLTYQGVGAVGYRVTLFPVLVNALNDAGITNADDTGLPVTNDDFTGMFQWSASIAPGDSFSGSGGGSSGPATCGNGLVEPGEVCDDGFTDACGTCNVDCTAVGSGLGACGDSTVCAEAGESCDDGNTTDDGNGCSATCELNNVWTGVTSDDWATGANWSGVGPPAAGELADIPSGTTFSPVLTTTTSIGSVRVRSGASLTLSAGANLTLSDGFTAESGSAVSMTAGTLNIAGDLTGTGATFTFGGGTTTFNGSGQQTLTDVNLADVSITNTSALVTIAGVVATDALNTTSGSDLVVTGGSTLTVDDVLNASGDVELRSNSVLQLGASTLHSVDGVFESSAGVGSRATVRNNGAGHYCLTLNGSINITRTDVEDLDTCGLDLNGPPTLDGMEGVTFADGIAGASLVYLTISDAGWANFTFANLSFEDTTAVGETTINNTLGTQVNVNPYATAGGYIFGPTTDIGNVNWVDPATYVDLVFARATLHDEGIEFEFETAAEYRNAGFILLRREHPEDVWATEVEWIEGLGTSPFGRVYLEWLPPGPSTTEFLLIDVEETGLLTEHGPIGVTAGAPVADETGPVDASTAAATWTPSSAPLRRSLPRLVSFGGTPRRYQVADGALLLTDRILHLQYDRSALRTRPSPLSEQHVRFEYPELPVVRRSAPGSLSQSLLQTFIEVPLGTRATIIDDTWVPSPRLQLELAPNAEARPISGTTRVRERLENMSRQVARAYGGLRKVASLGDREVFAVEASLEESDGDGVRAVESLHLRVQFEPGSSDSPVRSPCTESASGARTLEVHDRGLVALNLDPIDDILRVAVWFDDERLPIERDEATVRFYAPGPGGIVVEEDAEVPSPEISARASRAPGTESPLRRVSKFIGQEQYQPTVGGSEISQHFFFQGSANSGAFERDAFYEFELPSAPGAQAGFVWLETAALPNSELRYSEFFLNETRIGSSVTDSDTSWERFPMPTGVAAPGTNVLRVHLRDPAEVQANYKGVSDHDFAAQWLARARFELDVWSIDQAGDAPIELVGERGSYIQVSRPTLSVWEIVDAEPVILTSEDGQFAIDSGRSRLVVFDSEQLRRTKPERAPDSTACLSEPLDYLVVGPERFREAAEPLIAHRREQGLDSGFYSTEAIGVTWGHGQLDDHAISNFLSHVTSFGVRYVTFAGSANVDRRGWLPETEDTQHVDVVPTPLRFTRFFGETASDYGYSALGSDYPWLALGRIPARNVQQLQSYISKVLTYERGLASGDWQKRALVVTDAEPQFSAYGEQVADAIKAGLTVELIDRLNQPSADLAAALQGGALFVNYIGHGAGPSLGQDILTQDDVGRIDNHDHPFVLFSNSCLTGIFHYPGETSIVEDLLFSDGGAVAAVASSGMHGARAKEPLQEAFVYAMFQDGERRIGEALRHAWVANLAATEYQDPGDVNATTFVLGDSALLLQHPVPGAPRGVRAMQQEAQVVVSWMEPLENDIAEHRIYVRGPEAQDELRQAVSVVETNETVLQAFEGVAWLYVSAVDLDGNEGALSPGIWLAGESREPPGSTGVNDELGLPDEEGGGSVDGATSGGGCQTLSLDSWFWIFALSSFLVGRRRR